MGLFSNWKMWKFLVTLAKWLLKNHPNISELTQLSIEPIKIEANDRKYDYHASLIIKEKKVDGLIKEEPLELWHWDVCDWTDQRPPGSSASK
jgi:hypothetical protein